ncbi:MAG: DUF2752 domain-containing protein [Planctomycetes bacterium]|nr:DUF2752 domain-containing protein [Planctomycetota bacterium]
MTSESADSGPPAAQEYNRPSRRVVRLRGFIIAMPCLGLLAVAAILSPSGLGHGTHTDLKLPACGFLARTGYPCPTCGMTTAFAAMMHGRFGLAFGAQPFGAVLAIVVSCLALAGLAELFTAKSILHLLRPGYWMLWAGLAALIVGWALKIVIGLASGSLPVR